MVANRDDKCQRFPLVAGGQGRSARDVCDDGAWVAWLFLAGVVGLVLGSTL